MIAFIFNVPFVLSLSTEHTNNISVLFCLVTHCDVCVCEQYSLWRLPPWVTCGVSRFCSSASKNSSCSSVMANAEMKAA